MVPEGRVALVIVSRVGATTSVTAPLAVWAGLEASVTVTLKEKVPLIPGVPVMEPLDARVSPFGSELVADQV